MEGQTTQKAPCQPEVTRQDVLNLIPRHEIRSLFRRDHLKREQVIGFIGLRGDGKSAGCACLGLIDYMLWGKRVWSNMSIACDIEINKETAQKYGLKEGGVAHFAAEPLDKQALLKLDDSYRGGCLVIEEINVQYSNARRAMANTNIDFNMVVQEIRHLETSLIYNVIDEMFIDSQLRSLTDAFVKVEDTAYTLENLEKKKQAGLDFKWLVYPMSAAIAGRELSYYATKKPLEPYYFHFGRFRGIYNDKVFQHKGVYSESRSKAGKADITATSSEEITEEMDKWGWLAEKAQQLKEADITELRASDLWQFLELNKRGISPRNNELIAQLANWGITKWNQDTYGHYIYRIENFDLDVIKRKQGSKQLTTV